MQDHPLRPLPTAEELREQLQATAGSPARQIISRLFDDNTFVEISAYVKRAFCRYAETDQSAEWEGVIIGYGSLRGNLVFAFVQDPSRMKGAIDARHADKICRICSLARKQSAPLIGVFASDGADVAGGVDSLAAYARIIRAVKDLRHSVPTVAYVYGNCAGCAAVAASSFDLTVCDSAAHYYVANPEIGGHEIGETSVCYRGDTDACVSFIRSLTGFICETTAADDDLNRRLALSDWGGDARTLIADIADQGQWWELNANTAPVAVTALTVIGGVRCGIVGTSYSVEHGRISTLAARKIAAFVRLCEKIGVPVVNLVDSDGVDQAVDVLALGDLTDAICDLTVPTVSVLTGHANGAAFILLGSKSIGTDLVYALENCEISPLPSDAAVAFSWNDQINATVTRQELEARWRATEATPVAAASTGEVDDIIPVSELRARIASALLMLA